MESYDKAVAAGKAEYDVRRYQRAIPFFEKAGTIALASEAPVPAASALRWLGQCYSKLNNFPVALANYEKSLAGLKDLSGEFSQSERRFVDEELISTSQCRSMVLSTLGRFTEAIASTEYALNLAERIGGPAGDLVDLLSQLDWPVRPQP